MAVLRASTTSGVSRRNRNLDVLRGLAALGVVLWHATGRMDHQPVTLNAFWLVVLHSSATVYLFFALSGYLVGGPWVRALLAGTPLPNVRDYAVRRICRILPLYWVVLLAALILLRPPSVGPGVIALHVFLLQGFVPSTETLVYVVLWTLAVEAQFYVALPLVSWLIRRTRRRPLDARVALAGLALVWVATVPGLLFSGPTAGLAGTVLGQAGAFASGLAVVVVQSRSWLRLRGTYLFAAGGLLWVLASLTAVITDGPAPSPLWALAAFPLVLVAVRTKAWPLVPLAWVGTVSYSLYLCHLFVERVIPSVAAGGMAGLSVAFVELAVPSLAIAAVLYLLIERPSMSLGRLIERRLFHSVDGRVVARRRSVTADRP